MQGAGYYTPDRGLYLQRWKETVEGLLDLPQMAGRRICLLAHTYGIYGDESRNVVDVFSLLSEEARQRVVPVPDRILPTRARFILGNGLFTISGRMHPAVSTFQMGKPAIALAYSKKYNGVIGTMIGRGDLILDANDIVEEGHRAESAAVAATRARALAARQAESLLVAPLSHQNYTSLVRGGRVSGPSVARIVQLFGSWTSACAQAGVRSGDALRRHYSRTWSHEAVIGHVSSFLLEPAHRGASNRYDVWRAARGSKSTPSLGTVRNMCGARWHDIRTTALRSMRAGWAGGGAPA
jgi:hypothetical protein